jgi:hypothetical protein
MSVVGGEQCVIEENSVDNKKENKTAFDEKIDYR